MTTTLTEMFLDVRDACEDAHVVAFDGCHKIYLAMDETQAQWFEQNYEVVFSGSAHDKYEKLVEWYESSCSLRFIQAVETNLENPNEGYTNIVPQFADAVEEYETDK